MSIHVIWLSTIYIIHTLFIHSCWWTLSLIFYHCTQCHKKHPCTCFNCVCAIVFPESIPKIILKSLLVLGQLYKRNFFLLNGFPKFIVSWLEYDSVFSYSYQSWHSQSYFIANVMGQNMPHSGLMHISLSTGEVELLYMC